MAILPDMQYTINSVWLRVCVSLAVFVAVTAVLVVRADRASGAPKDVATVVDSAVVDVNTTLGYEQGAAAGTGIVLTSSGEILTNNHVIRDATDVKVTDVGNGQTYSATVVGYDVADDIAVLQLKNASGLNTIAIGSSSAVKLGQAVTAIGNAGGVAGTPRTANGAVTGLGKSITATDDDGTFEQLKGLIRTNAALEPGDSGGPLVDGNGRVVGIDTAASSGFSFQDQQQGGTVGYAIPIAKALSIASKITGGHSSATTHIGPTALLGVQIQQAVAEDRYGYGGYGYGDGYNATPAGALVAVVLPNSPAEQGGLEAGDTIISVDGQKINTPTTLTNVLLRYAPNTTVTLTWVDQYQATHHGSVRLGTGPAQ